jgi:Gnt-I system low-affinity gluconate transporter
VLITTGVGQMLADEYLGTGTSVLIFAFVSALIVRLLQGSATVAMITAAGLTFPLLSQAVSDPEKALLVVAIAAGASSFSNVNDSGFWLVSKYLGISEKDTFLSWTVMTIIIGTTSMAVILVASLIM